MRDFPFVGSDGRTHKPTDPDYWQAKTRELEGTVRELTTAVVDIQHRLSRLDGDELQWPGDTYEPTHTEPVGVGSERLRVLEDRVELALHDTLGVIRELDERVQSLERNS